MLDFQAKADEEDKFGGGEGEKVVENDHFVDGDLVLNDHKVTCDLCCLLQYAEFTSIFTIQYHIMKHT